METIEPQSVRIGRRNLLSRAAANLEEGQDRLHETRAGLEDVILLAIDPAFGLPPEVIREARSCELLIRNQLLPVVRRLRGRIEARCCELDETL